MKAILSKSMWMTALFVVFLMASCSEKDSLSVDEQAMVEEIQSDPDEIYGLEIMGEEDPTNFGKASGLSKSAAAIEPEGYGRRVRIRREAVDIVRSDDGMSATATITYLLVGQFVLADHVEGTNEVSLFFKPLRHRIQRRVQFQKITDSTELANSDRAWKRVGITPAYGISADGTLGLTGDVSIKITDGQSQNVSEWTISDPLNYFFESAHELPLVHPGDKVHIEVAIANSGTDGDPYGIVHRGKRKAFRSEKESFNDDGENGDVTAGDGIYTIEWEVLPLLSDAGFHIGVIDFFSSNTIFESSADAGPYNSLVVALPYNKQPR